MCAQANENMESNKEYSAFLLIPKTKKANNQDSINRRSKKCGATYKNRSTES